MKIQRDATENFIRNLCAECGKNTLTQRKASRIAAVITEVSKLL